MSDWKTQQMIKASGWPEAPEALAIGANFNQATASGLVPLHWACQHGKAGLVRHMIAHGANVADVSADGKSMLALALDAQDFQTLMLLIDHLKATGAPPPDEATQERMTQSFRGSHPDSRNRILQTLRDWERIARKNRA
ncbi:MAG TPA: ankyrin repeat domain-containing protein [Polaromonas sp.]|nr:ankyrin repeat domain-containing protein [Polaromonas sp.]